MARTLDEIVTAGRAAWPEVTLDAHALHAHLDARRAGRTRPSDTEPIPDEHAADFYLACACVLGNERAVREVDGILRRDVTRAVSRVDPRPSFVDDAMQTLREKLFVGDAPKIAEYSGRSSLAKWLRTVAARTALNLVRGRANAAADPLGSQIAAVAARAPEIEILRARYREPFQEALRAALDTLTERERVLIRMNVVERLGVDRLARVYACGRSTAARWVAAARAKLLDGVTAHLREHAGLTRSDVQSLATFVRSELDVSIVRLLGDGPDLP